MSNIQGLNSGNRSSGRGNGNNGGGGGGGGGPGGQGGGGAVLQLPQTTPDLPGEGQAGSDPLGLEVTSIAS